MGRDTYFIVTEGGASATEELPRMGGKAAFVCERYDLTEEGETLESIKSSDLALLLDARADIECVRIRTPPSTENCGQTRVPRRRCDLILNRRRRHRRRSLARSPSSSAGDLSDEPSGP
jgi:hypothetical protein